MTHTFSHSRLTAFPDEPSKFWNAPVGLQLVGRTLEEEAVIGMTEKIIAALGAHKD